MSMANTFLDLRIQEELECFRYPNVFLSVGYGDGQEKEKRRGEKKTHQTQKHFQTKK